MDRQSVYRKCGFNLQTVKKECHIFSELSLKHRLPGQTPNLQKKPPGVHTWSDRNFLLLFVQTAYVMCLILTPALGQLCLCYSIVQNTPHGDMVFRPASCSKNPSGSDPRKGHGQKTQQRYDENGEDEEDIGAGVWPRRKDTAVSPVKF